MYISDHSRQEMENDFAEELNSIKDISGPISCKIELMKGFNDRLVSQIKQIRMANLALKVVERNLTCFTLFSEGYCT